MSRRRAAGAKPPRPTYPAGRWIKRKAVAVGILVALSLLGKGVTAAQQESSPLIIPVYALCGEGAPPGGPATRYATRIDITMTSRGEEGEENGEIVVAPDILAGEVNPGETIVVGCEEILQGRESFFGFVTVQLFPGEAFVVNVTYENGGSRLENRRAASR